MSCYLNIYLVPKIKEEDKDKVKEQHLFLDQYSRNSDLYQLFDETLCVPYMTKGFTEEGKEEEIVYKELTTADIAALEEYNNNEIETTEKKLSLQYKILEKQYNEDLKDDIMALEEFLDDSKKVKRELAYIKNLVESCVFGWSDFARVEINKG